MDQGHSDFQGVVQREAYRVGADWGRRQYRVVVVVYLFMYKDVDSFRVPLVLSESQGGTIQVLCVLLPCRDKLLVV